ncbi:MAG: sigma-54-dependent Fis family transcriptional regulator [Candidatus Eisenbacteria bacterium]|nr:sigma-54-dependent Fis family transcriptional regulator [Candidatus Eisenbacteria bacterium]
MESGRLSILVVDDQSSVRELLRALLEGDEHKVDTAPDGASAIELLRSGFHDLVMTDLRMPGMDGLEALKRIKQLSPETSVVVMTAYASVETAVTAMKLGAFDYITKPIDIEEVRRVIDRWVEGAREPEEAGDDDVEPTTDIVGASEELREVLEVAHRVAESDATVLLLGESGTGKDVIAREIHRSSHRINRPFVAVNCSAIPEGLLESELFGHEKGSFTGAVRQKRGKFETADGGTVFLDEIGDMSEALQAKLLRFLQDHVVQRVGGSVDVKVDVRVIAATNKDLEAEVATGGFREDLYFRLNVVTITLPPLRDRTEDIPLLIEHFLRKHTPRGGKPKKMSPSAIRLAMGYVWPGNIRELENAVQRAIVLSRGETIFPEHLPAKVQAAGEGSEGVPRPEGRTMREVERQTIIKTLRQTDGNRTHAAKILGISRRTLQNKIKEYGIDI